MENLLNWSPVIGRYRKVIPGNVSIDLYLDGRVAEAHTLSTVGQEVELFQKEVRALKRSKILTHGWLIPVQEFILDEKGDVEKEVDFFEDVMNPNVVSDEAIAKKVKGFKSVKTLTDYIDRIDSLTTLERIYAEAVKQDLRQSYIREIETRIEKIRHEEVFGYYEQKMPIDERRQSLLTPKLKK